MEKFNKTFLTVLTVSLFSLIALQTGLGLFNQTSNILGLQDIGTSASVRPIAATLPPQPVLCKTGINTFNIYTTCGVEKFRYSVFKCYDGTTSTQGGPTSCKTGAEWKEIAQGICAGKSNCPITPTPTPIVRAVPCDAAMKVFNDYCYANNSALTLICSSLKAALYPYCPFLPPVTTPTPLPSPTITPTPTPDFVSANPVIYSVSPTKVNTMGTMRLKITGAGFLSGSNGGSQKIIRSLFFRDYRGMTRYTKGNFTTGAEVIYPVWTDTEIDTGDFTVGQLADIRWMGGTPYGYQNVEVFVGIYDYPNGQRYLGISNSVLITNNPK